MSGLRTEEFVINMGPHHPSTHGVCRLMLTMDGENFGNGILTTENEAQAIYRADPKQGNKGAGAAEAAMALLALQERYA